MHRVHERSPDDPGVAEVALGRLWQAGEHLLGHERRMSWPGRSQEPAAISFDEAIEPPACDGDEQGGKDPVDRELDGDKASERTEQAVNLGRWRWRWRWRWWMPGAPTGPRR
jgi:hypothetical protein